MTKFEKLYDHEKLLQSQRDAAPELYEALEGLLATHKQGKGQCCEAADRAIDALAKARGE